MRYLCSIVATLLFAGTCLASPFSIPRDIEENYDNQSSTAGKLLNRFLISDSNSFYTATQADAAMTEVGIYATNLSARITAAVATDATLTTSKNTLMATTATLTTSKNTLITTTATLTTSKNTLVAGLAATDIDVANLAGASVQTAQIKMGALQQIKSTALVALSGSTAPTLTFTDGAYCVTWAAASVTAIAFSTDFPPNMDDASAMYVDIVAKSGSTDAIALTLYSYWGDGTGNNSTYVTDSSTTDTSAVAKTYTITIAAGDVANVNSASFVITPGVHGTNELRIYAIRVRYAVTY